MYVDEWPTKSPISSSEQPAACISETKVCLHSCKPIGSTSVDGRIVGIVVMIVGVGFLSVLTAAIASVFVKTDRGSEHQELTDALKKIELELAG